MAGNGANGWGFMRFPALFLALMLPLRALAGAGPADPASLCETAIADAAVASGVPAALLHAIALVESGRGGRPWPWAINVQGRGTWHASQADLAAHVHALQAAGETRFDIGCLQINAHWHGAAFASPAAMADPQTNARYAAAFLARLNHEFGSWEAAAGAYHSRTPDLAAAYRARVLAHITPLPAPPEAMPPDAPAPLAYPLMLAGAPGALASTVPAQSARAPFLPGLAPR